MAWVPRWFRACSWSPSSWPGTLRMLVPHEFDSGLTYRLIFPEHMEGDDTLSRLRTWLRETIGKSTSR